MFLGGTDSTDPAQGVVDKPIEEGTHFRVPWLQTPNIMDIRYVVCCVVQAHQHKYLPQDPAPQHLVRDWYQGYGGCFQLHAHSMHTLAASPTDLQMVNITMRVLSKPDTEKLATIFKGLGPDWEERVLPSIGNEVVKAVVAQYNAEQLITQRDKVSRMVRSCD